ncbi:hypothetical protein D5086_005334 [Populus alba]|uniref:Uncharacterized protein n=1 Tax=Populus alba TaxID=43335 RepID=A0ACC4CU48_POPAL
MNKKRKFDPYLRGTALYMAPESVADHVQEAPSWMHSFRDAYRIAVLTIPSFSLKNAHMDCSSSFCMPSAEIITTIQLI